jgi:broad specificity phosphatase PhoE
MSVSKSIELRRHTDNDGDVLTPEGTRAALEIGRRLAHDYALLVSSGAQRATQTLACFAAVLGSPVPDGAVVEPALRSEREDRWRELFREAGSGELARMQAVDPAFVGEEAARLADGLRRILDALPDGGRALAVGHSPTNEVAVLGLTGEVIAPLAKGAGVVVVDEGAGRFRVERVG